MATFTYVARDQTGESTRGELSAPTKAEAARTLRSEGKFVVKLDEQAQKTTAQQAAQAGGSKRVKHVDIIYFSTQMAVMLETGVPVADALEGILQQTPHGAMRRVLSDLLRGVASGEPFSEALSKHPKAFSSLYVNLIRAAEMSGRLGETLSQVSAYMTRQREIIRRVRGALIYPAILVVMSVGMVIFLMTFLLPKFLAIYRGKMDMLPTPTKILIATSNFLVNYWMYWTSGIVAAVVGAVLFLRTPTGRMTKDWLALHTPIIGKMMHKALVTRSLQTLGTLIDSGVSMLDTVDITKRVVSNHYFRELFTKVDHDLHQGHQLSGPLYQSRLFPRPVVQMLEAGERSGQLGPVMKRISSFLEDDLNTSIRQATAMIEPLMIVVMGAVVGSIAIAMLLPIFTLSKVVR